MRGAAFVRGTIAAMLPLAIAACGQPSSDQAPANDAIANAVAANATMANAATPAATPAATGPLSAYVGKYPFDKVAGAAFLENSLVRTAVESTTPDAAIRSFVLSGKGPMSPITGRDGKVVAWGCETHNCGDHNWTLSVAPDGTGAELCLIQDGKSPRWFTRGAEVAGRTEACPPSE